MQLCLTLAPWILLQGMTEGLENIQSSSFSQGLGERFFNSCKQFRMSVPRRPLSRLIRSAPVQVGASVVLAGAGLYALDALLAAALRDTLQELPSPPQADTPLLPHDTHIQHQVPLALLMSVSHLDETSYL